MTTEERSQRLATERRAELELFITQMHRESKSRFAPIRAHSEMSRARLEAAISEVEESLGQQVA